jgi:Ras-related protein Rab-2A
MYNYLFKCIIVGDTNVGKSCIVLRFTDNSYRKNHETTIGVEFGHKIISIKNEININDPDNIFIKLHIWDTAGQECFKSITRSYYRGAVGIILVYDVTNCNSFKNIITWLNEIKNYNLSEKRCIILIGNKIDLPDRIISTEEGLTFAKNNNLLFFETSALLSDNIELIFQALAQNIYNISVDNITNTNGIILGPKNNTIEVKKKCC